MRIRERIGQRIVTVVGFILLAICIIWSAIVTTASMIPLESGGSGGLSYAKDDAEAYEDYLKDLVRQGFAMDEESLPKAVDEVYVIKVAGDGAGDDMYMATLYYSGEISDYTLVGDLSGEMHMVQDGWWLTPNNHLYGFNQTGVIERLLQEYSATGEILVLSWPCQEPKLNFEQKLFLHTAAKIKIYQYAHRSSLSMETMVCASLIVLLVVFGVNVAIWSNRRMLRGVMPKILAGACAVVLLLTLITVAWYTTASNREISVANQSSSIADNSESSSEATYKYFDEHGWCVAGVCGTTDYSVEGGRKYIIDETVILGPFQEMPNITITMLGTDISATTEGLGICDDYTEQAECNSGEERWFGGGDIYGGIAATRYADGEIYLSVKFYRTEDSVTIEPRPDLDEIHNATRAKRIITETMENGLRDYFLYPASDGDVVTLAYDLDSLVVE